MKEFTNKDQITLLKVKALLKDLSYIIKDEHMQTLGEFYRLCKKYCSFGEQNEES